LTNLRAGRLAFSFGAVLCAGLAAATTRFGRAALVAGGTGGGEAATACGGAAAACACDAAGGDGGNAGGVVGWTGVGSGATATWVGTALTCRAGALGSDGGTGKEAARSVPIVPIAAAERNHKPNFMSRLTDPSGPPKKTTVEPTPI